jgi:hypothetical protein
MFAVTIDRNDPGKASYGSGNLAQLIAMAKTREHALRFQALLGEALNGSLNAGIPQESGLDKLAKLKSLLDAGAINQQEFDEQKAKILSQM